MSPSELSALARLIGPIPEPRREPTIEPRTPESDVATWVGSSVIRRLFVITWFAIASVPRTGWIPAAELWMLIGIVRSAVKVNPRT